MAEHLHHLLWLALAQQPVVDVNTGELFADGANQKGSHYGGVHTAGEGQQDLPVSDLLPDQLHLVGNEVLHIPIGLGAAHTEHEIGEGLLAFLLIAGPGLITLVVGQKDGDIVVVDLLGGVDLNTVHHPVGAAV